MKKILDLIKYLFKDADFVMVFVIFCVVFVNVIFACTLETCTSCNSNSNKTPVEESTNIDSIKGVNTNIEKEITNLDSIKNELHNKIDSLDYNATIELFKKLLSD